MKARLTALIFAAGLLGGAIAAEPEATSPAAPAPAPDRTVFAPRLPTPAELTAIATAQGQTIERIEQSGAQVTITTRTAEGKTTTVLYQLLATAANVTTQAAPAARATTVVVEEEPEVVYAPRRRYYYDPYYWDYWPPVSVNLGFGWGWGYRGGYRGHGHVGWRH